MNVLRTDINLRSLKLGDLYMGEGQTKPIIRIAKIESKPRDREVLICKNAKLTVIRMIKLSKLTLLSGKRDR